MTLAKAELVLGVLIMASATIYLQTSRRGKRAVSWAALILATAFILFGLRVFLEGVHDVRLFL